MRGAALWIPGAALALLAGACSAGGSGGGGALKSPSAGTTAAAPVASPAPACHAPYTQGTPTSISVRCADPAGMTSGRVVRIVDGDTLHVSIGGRDETVRLFGVDTPERGEACFSEASLRLEQLAASEVRLKPDQRERDRFGRLLRYLYTPAGLSIDAELVAEGLGHAWREDGALRGAIIGLEDEARAAGRGCLWRRG